MAFLSICLPLIVACVSAIWGRYLSSNGVSFLATLGVFFAFILSLLLGYEILNHNSFVILPLFDGFSLEVFQFQWTLLVDTLGVVMLILVNLVSFLVHLYSIDYMGSDPHKARFFIYLGLFTFFMLFLVCSSNLFQFFFAWEGVGLCSYLLVNFWFTRTQANSSALKAFVVNRVGDLSFLIGLIACICFSQSSDFYVLGSLIQHFNDFSVSIFGCSCDLLGFVIICLFGGTMSKSAQIFLHTWLPDAMEGPTPVSALIHAATMVAAGVFLLLRCSFFILPGSPAAAVVVMVGAATAFFAASIGFFQNDVKKIVAYSTCSQLGYMVVAAGLSAFSGAFFHLVNHAFFKALLFLSSGALIHSLNDQQDIRRMGGLLPFLPIVYMMFFIGSLALSGFPFFSGFYSKDFIIEAALTSSNLASTAAALFLVAGAFFTVLYSTRLILLVFFGQPLLQFSSLLFIHQPSVLILTPLAVLSLFAIFFGSVCADFFNPFRFFVFHVFSPALDFEFLSFFHKLAPLFASVAGAFCALCVHRFGQYLPKSPTWLFFAFFFAKKWFFDVFYNFFFGLKVFIVAYNFFLKSLDKGFFELFGPQILTTVLTQFSRSIRSLQTAYLPHYLGYFLFSIILVLAALCVPHFFLSKAFFIDFIFLALLMFPNRSNSVFYVARVVFSRANVFNKAFAIYVYMFILWVYPIAFTTYCYTMVVCFIIYVNRYHTMPLAYLCVQ